MNRIPFKISLVMLLSTGCSSPTASRRDTATPGQPDEANGEDQSVVNKNAVIPMVISGVKLAEIARIEIAQQCLLSDCSKKLLRPDVVLKTGKHNLLTAQSAKTLGISKIKWSAAQPASACLAEQSDDYSRTCQGAPGSALAVSVRVSLTLAADGQTVEGSNIVEMPQPVGAPSKIYLAYEDGPGQSGQIRYGGSGGTFSGPRAADARCNANTSFLSGALPGKTVKWFSPVWDWTGLKARLDADGIRDVVQADGNSLSFTAGIYVYERGPNATLLDEKIVGPGVEFLGSFPVTLYKTLHDLSGVNAATPLSGWYGLGCSDWSSSIDTDIGETMTFYSASAGIGQANCRDARHVLCMAAVYD